MADQFLVYPYRLKYSTDVSTYGDQVKDGGKKNGPIPISNQIHRGNYQQNTNGTNWWGESFGSDNMDSSITGQYSFEQQNKGSKQKGFHYWMQTSSNGKQTSRWWDLGDEGGKTHGSAVSNSSKSSWLRGVCGIWFLFNAHDTTQTRDCYARIEHAALRYRDPDGKVAIYKVTQKLGYLAYNAGHRGSSKVVFGYQLSSSDRSRIIDGNYHLLGVRVQFKLRRGSSGTTTDTVQAGISGLRFSIGDASNSWDTTTKRALVGSGNCTWSDYSGKSKIMLETR